MKTKQLFLTLALAIVTFTSFSQEKYDFMLIEFNRSLKVEIQISINGKQYLQEMANYSGTVDERHNANPLFNKVNEYQDKGWELMNFQVLNIGSGGDLQFYYAFLRKLKEK